MDKYAFLNASDPAVIDALYEQFKADPSQLDPELKRFF